MISFSRFLRLAFAVGALALSAFAGEMPFPQVENGMVRLEAKNSPYILEQGMVLSASDTFEVEPGVTVFMGEYAKLMLRGPVRIAGTSENLVRFCSVDTNETWNGIHFVSSGKPFEVKHLVIENAFRNTVFRSRGIFESVQFVNNFYGLWLDEVSELFLVRCKFLRNRYALSVRAGKVLASETEITSNVYGLYQEAGGVFEGDSSLVQGNLEADFRQESEELAGKGKRVNRNMWHRIETLF